MTGTVRGLPLLLPVVVSKRTRPPNIEEPTFPRVARNTPMCAATNILANTFMRRIYRARRRPSRSPRRARCIPCAHEQDGPRSSRRSRLQLAGVMAPIHRQRVEATAQSLLGHAIYGAASALPVALVERYV